MNKKTPMKGSGQEQLPIGKQEMVKLLLEAARHDSRTRTAARQYLLEEGIEPGQLLAEGMKRIRRMKLELAAASTRKKMQEARAVRERAVAWVDALLERTTLSLAQLVQQENLTIYFRNMEKLDREDIRHILVRHYTLRFMKEQEDSL